MARRRRLVARARDRAAKAVDLVGDGRWNGCCETARMDRVLFCTKRSHLSYTAHANRHLARWNLTAARMDLFVCHRAALRQYGVVYQRDLRARLGVSRATVAVMLRRLEKRGFVERRRSDGDRRRVVVTITPAGYNAFEKARHLVDDGVYLGFVDSTLTFVDFAEPLQVKRTRFLLYVDNLRATFGDLTDPPYAIDTVPRDAVVDQLLSKYVTQ